MNSTDALSRTRCRERQLKIITSKRLAHHSFGWHDIT